jgi:hypothetical protein
MSPDQCLAVDVLLQLLVPHEQAEAGARPPPIASRLASIPFARREPEHLALDVAALEYAREDFDGQGGNLHWPAAHRAGVIDQQRNGRTGKR